MTNCFECAIGVAHNADSIGVCMRCNSLACANHGGKPRGQPRFMCSGCIIGLLTTSAGGSPPPPPGPGGGPSGGGPGPSGGPGGGSPLGPSPGGSSSGPSSGGEAAAHSGVVSPATFTSTLDFELQLPNLAAASEDRRRFIRSDALKETLRRLFRLKDDEESRADFLVRASEEVEEPVRDQVARQLRFSGGLRDIFEDERGGLDGMTTAGVGEIISRVGDWIRTDMPSWMASIHPDLDETAWLGEAYTTRGAIDMVLFADALGLNAYVWNLQPGESPFRRLDVVGGADTSMLVLSELYAQSTPIAAGGGVGA